MSGTGYSNQLSMRVLPQPGTATAVTASTSTAAIDLSAHRNAVVTMVYIPDVPANHSCHLRGGSSSVGAATGSDYGMVELVEHRFIVHRGAEFVRFFATADGDVFWAKAEIS